MKEVRYLLEVNDFDAISDGEFKDYRIDHYYEGYRVRYFNWKGVVSYKKISSAFDGQSVKVVTDIDKKKYEKLISKKSIVSILIESKRPVIKNKELYLERVTVLDSKVTFYTTEYEYDDFGIDIVTYIKLLNMVPQVVKIVDKQNTTLKELTLEIINSSSNDVLYHGSPVKGLSKLKPMKSNLSKKPVVFAGTKWMGLSNVCRWDDTVLRQETIKGVPYITEMYKNALYDVYHKGGYLYMVSGKNFQQDGNIQGDEYFSYKTERILKTEYINDPINEMKALGVNFIKYKPKKPRIIIIKGNPKHTIDNNITSIFYKRICDIVNSVYNIDPILIESGIKHSSLCETTGKGDVIIGFSRGGSYASIWKEYCNNNSLFIGIGCPDYADNDIYITNPDDYTSSGDMETSSLLAHWTFTDVMHDRLLSVLKDYK